MFNIFRSLGNAGLSDLPIEVLAAIAQRAALSGREDVEALAYASEANGIIDHRTEAEKDEAALLKAVVRAAEAASDRRQAENEARFASYESSGHIKDIPEAREGLAHNTKITSVTTTTGTKGGAFAEATQAAMETPASASGKTGESIMQAERSRRNRSFSSTAEGKHLDPQKGIRTYKPEEAPSYLTPRSGTTSFAREADNDPAFDTMGTNRDVAQQEAKNFHQQSKAKTSFDQHAKPTVKPAAPQLQFVDTKQPLSIHQTTAPNDPAPALAPTG